MAKKKYHQSPADRMHERRGEKEYHEGMKAEMDRTMRRGVVPHESGPEERESDRYFANLPTEVRMEQFPKGFGYPMDMSLYIDNVGGLDKLQNQDQGKVARNMWSPLDRGERG